MAITQRGSATVGATSSGLTVAVPVPAGAQAGDVLVAFVASQEGTAVAFAASGWTARSAGYGETNAGGARITTVLTLVVTDPSALPSTVTFTRGGSSGRNVAAMITLQGVDVLSPIDAMGVWASNSTTAGTTVPSVTTTKDGALVVTAFNANAGAGTNMTPVTGTGKLLHTQSPAGTADSNTSASRTLLALFASVQATAGASGVMSVTTANASGQKAGFRVAFRPAAEVAPPSIIPTTGAKYFNGTSEVDVQLARWDGTTESRIASLEAYDANVYDWAAFASERPFFIAHRGGSFTWPEMSAAAYRRAARIYGMRALEMSVHRSSDGVFVLHHDPTTTRATGQAYTIADTPWSTLSTLKTLASKSSNPNQPDEFIARLDEVLPLYIQNRVIFLEDKTYNTANRNALIAYVKSLPGWQNVVWKVAGMSSNAAANAGTIAGMRSWGYLFSGGDMTDPDFVAKAQRFTFIGPDMNFTASEWALVKSTGVPLIAHIIQTQAQLDTVLSHSPVGVMLANAQLFPR